MDQCFVSGRCSVEIHRRRSFCLEVEFFKQGAHARTCILRGSSDGIGWYRFSCGLGRPSSVLGDGGSGRRLSGGWIATRTWSEGMFPRMWRAPAADVAIV